tara:strand:+ start:2388 stop:2987 length:600 start_codon:yes stop_codon:yes gene_type:complete
MFIDKAVSGLGELTPAKLAEASTYNVNPKVKFGEGNGAAYFQSLTPEFKSKYAYRFQTDHDDLVNDGKLGPLTVAKLIAEAGKATSNSGEYNTELSKVGIDDMIASYPSAEYSNMCGSDEKDSCYIHGVLPFFEATAIKASRPRPQPGPTPGPVPNIDDLPEPLQAGAGPNVGLLALGGVLLFAAYRSFQGKPLLPGMK